MVHSAKAVERRSLLSPDPCIELSEGERGALRALNLLLDNEPEFIFRRFPPGSAPFLRQLDVHWKEQLRIEAEEMVVHWLRSYRGAPEGAGEECQRALDEAASYACQSRGKIKALIDFFENRPTITIIGAQRGHIWNDELEQTANGVVHDAVARGLTIVIGGDGPVWPAAFAIFGLKPSGNTAR